LKKIVPRQEISLAVNFTQSFHDFIRTLLRPMRYYSGFRTSKDE